MSKLIEFQTPDGPTWVDPSTVAIVRPGQQAAGIEPCAMIGTHGGSWTLVRGQPADVARRIEDAQGPTAAAFDFAPLRPGVELLPFTPDEPAEAPALRFELRLDAGDTLHLFSELRELAAAFLARRETRS